MTANSKIAEEIKFFLDSNKNCSENDYINVCRALFKEHNVVLDEAEKKPIDKKKVLIDPSKRNYTPRKPSTGMVEPRGAGAIDWEFEPSFLLASIRRARERMASEDKNEDKKKRIIHPRCFE